jgi:transposase InsO family protein
MYRTESTNTDVKERQVSTWVADIFIADLPHEHRPRILIVCEWPARTCLLRLVDRYISADRVLAELKGLAQKRGYPDVLLTDRALEFVSPELTGWLEINQIKRRIGVPSMSFALGNNWMKLLMDELSNGTPWRKR